MTIAKEPDLIDTLGVGSAEAAQTKLIELIDGLDSPARDVLSASLNRNGDPVDLLRRRDKFIEAHPEIAGSRSTFERREEPALTALAVSIADEHIRRTHNQPASRDRWYTTRSSTTFSQWIYFGHEKDNNLFVALGQQNWTGDMLFLSSEGAPPGLFLRVYLDRGECVVEASNRLSFATWKFHLVTDCKLG